MQSVKTEKPIFRDWRPEVIRIFAIFVVVLFHLEFYTHNLVAEIGNPLVLLGGVAIGAFMITSGYVYGLKDEFNKPGLLNRSSYKEFLKKRVVKLYIGYYLALIVVLIAKLLSGHTIEFSTTSQLTYYYQNPIQMTPLSITLDITGLWSLITGNSGGIWPEGWFITAMLILAIVYPFLRRIYSINKRYLYSIIISTVIARISIISFFNPNWAYYFPFAWTTEFSLGIILGDYARKASSSVTSKSDGFCKKIIVNMGSRVWPIYLVHISAIVFMPDALSILNVLVCIATILILAEIIYQILKNIYKRILAGQGRSVIQQISNYNSN